jgi:hypothetical protein
MGLIREIVYRSRSPIHLSVLEVCQHLHMVVTVTFVTSHAET